MPIVYQHRRKDTKEIFYIGIGKDESRAYEYGRNYLWEEVIKETDYNVEITHTNIIWEEACSIEKYLISFWGRKDLRLGSLTNLTDGGDGTNNLSLESRNKIKEKLTGVKHTKERVFNVSKAIKNLSIDKKNKMLNGSQSWIGRKHKPEFFEKQKETLKNIFHSQGENNSQFGTCWITNGKENKKIKKDTSIPSGWILGRKIKK